MTREEEIFSEAVALPPADRAAFLERACAGEPALLVRVTALLEAFVASERFMSGSLSARLDPRPQEKPGDVIGRYTLLKKIGEGGCGVVYLAEQTVPVRRRVALKVIKLGMDTREVIARFEAERQALAMMDHPDIARVFDAGATAAGRPFFVMEFVDGVPITKFCDTHRLALAARLELFARVCLALQHAHQKGIVHRDVKPSNILVALHDGVPTPKVIDFGIAKATQGRLTEHTLVTGLEQFIGTPIYMSPEQAELRDLDIDTRSDIYSLGVLLYELLTGRPPFDPKSLIRAGVEEIRRIIREVDPPRPSTVVSTLAGADRATVAQHRGAAPARLTSVLRGDLDWIVMRCLEKDRARRYETAHELADDVRRHLRSEPVNARPPTLPYRAQKFVTRHRFACASAATIVLALVAGAVISTWQAVRATRAERAALRAEHVARVAQADAQRRQAEAEDLLAFMLGDFRAELAKIGKLKLLDAVGDKASAYFAALDPRDQTDTTLLRHAKALTQIGEIRLDQARFAEADQALLAAHRRASALTDRHPRDGEMLFTRAQVEYWLGVEHRKRGDLAEASRWLTSYRDSALRLVGLDPEKPEWQEELGYGHHNLAVLEMDRGNYEAARAGFRAELDILLRTSAAKPGGGSTTLRYNIANLYSWLGSAAEWSGDYAAARACYEEQVTRLEALVTAEPGNARWQARLAEALSFQADLAARTVHRAEAQALNRRARELIGSLNAKDPANRTWQRLSLGVQLREAELLRISGDEEGAIRLAVAGRAELEKLVQLETASRDFAVLLVKAWRCEADFRLARGQPEAVVAAEKSVELGERLVGADKVNGNGLGEVLGACVVAAAIHERAAETDRAGWLRKRVVALVEPQLAQSRDWRLLDPAARALAGLGRLAEAREIAVRLTGTGYRPLSPWPAAVGP